MKRIPQSYLEDLKDKIRLSEFIGRSLTLKRAGSEWAACCPFHADKSPSFFIDDRKAHYWCHGCGTHGDALTWIMRRENLAFEDAVKRLAEIAGQPQLSDAQRFEANLVSRAAEHAQRRPGPVPLSDDQRARQAQARAIWRNSKPFIGSLAQTYLKSRGIHVGKWPPCLRFAEQAWHGWEQTKFPALIAAIQDGCGQISAVQTTFIRSDGLGKAGVTPPKPVTGPMGDGAIRLGKPSAILGIAEGIETALSARQIYSLPVWAACGASRLGSVKIPEGVTEVLIFGDNGERGKAEAHKAAEHYGAQGYAFGCVFPDSEYDDFNSALQQRTKAA